MKKTLPVSPFFTSLVISARASSTSARTRVDTWVVASLTRSPIDGSAGRTCGSVSGIDVMVFGTPFLRSPLVTDIPSVFGRSWSRVDGYVATRREKVDALPALERVNPPRRAADAQVAGVVWVGFGSRLDLFRGACFEVRARAADRGRRRGAALVSRADRRDSSGQSAAGWRCRHR